MVAFSSLLIMVWARPKGWIYFQCFAWGGYHTPSLPSMPHGDPDACLCPALHTARSGRVGLGRRHVLRLADTAPGGSRSAGRASAPAAVAGSFPTFLRMGLAGRGGAGDQWYRHVAPALRRLRRRATPRSGDDRRRHRDVRAVHARAGAAAPGVARRRAGRGLGLGCCGAGQDPTDGRHQSVAGRWASPWWPSPVRACPFDRSNRAAAQP